MTRNEVDTRAARLGLSTWMVEAVAVGEKSQTVTLKCVGFASLGIALGEAESWEEALSEAMRVIFSP